MKYVHLTCLNSWRYSSPNAKSVYRCDQCGYKYNFNRTQYAAIVGSVYTRVFPYKSTRVLIKDNLYHPRLRSRHFYFRIHIQIHSLSHWCHVTLHQDFLHPRLVLWY